MIQGMQREYTAVIQKCGRWCAAWIEEIPGVNTQGRTLKEVRRNLREALQLILEERRQMPEGRSRDVRREPIAIEA